MKQIINLNSLKILNFFKLLNISNRFSLLWLSLFGTWLHAFYFFTIDFYYSLPHLFSSICQSRNKRSIRGPTHTCVRTYPRSLLFHSWSQKANTSLNRIMAGKVALRDRNVSYLFRVGVSPRFEIFNGGHGVNYYGSRKKDPERERSYLVGKYNSRPLS